MNTTRQDSTTCLTCGKPNVIHGRNYVQADNWKRAYPRTLHTPAECAAYAAGRQERLTERGRREQVAVDFNSAQARASQLIERYKAIYGPEAAAAAWERLTARWLTHWVA